MTAENVVVSIDEILHGHTVPASTNCKTNYLEVFCDLPFNVPFICKYIATLHDDIYTNTIAVFAEVVGEGSGTEETTMEDPTTTIGRIKYIQIIKRITQNVVQNENIKCFTLLCEYTLKLW